MTPEQAVTVRAVVFDLGGVLTTDPFAGMVAYAEDLGIPSSSIADAVRTGPQFQDVETGRSTMRDFLKWLCVDIETRYGVRVDIRRLAAALAAGQQVRPEMLVLVRDLRAAGARIGLLTNNAREAKSWWESGVLPLEEFDVVLDSSDLGVRKPDPEAFRITLDRLGLEPAEVAFVDDLAVNVDGARAVGLHGLVFEDPAQCRAELTALLDRSAPVTTTGNQ
ncbi:HAD family hydrolase [Nocardioides marmoriginsengisoli]|uniref:HAD family hydrolase n=1 Tax=Nocardioides marmoriginsengisoli TaxID=661483 RepID=UPI00161BE067|nr:HAD family phosphatase [Nocardioides marmoriginsengisoli]